MSFSYRNKSIDLQNKSLDCFLYEREALVVKGLTSFRKFSKLESDNYLDARVTLNMKVLFMLKQI